MWSRILAILQKEFIQIRRDQRTLISVLLMQTLQLLVFGYAINTVVDHLPTVGYDESNDAYSRAFVAAFQNSGYFDIRSHVYSRDDAQAAIICKPLPVPEQLRARGFNAFGHRF